ncbi:hypothetical protein MICRO116_660045 [Micrococcus sp. 116]|nr:hypothetical protein MICRO116_660045 [Micrococcus sp. 116]
MPTMGMDLSSALDGVSVLTITLNLPGPAPSSGCRPGTACSSPTPSSAAWPGAAKPDAGPCLVRCGIDGVRV